MLPSMSGITTIFAVSETLPESQKMEVMMHMVRQIVQLRFHTTPLYEFQPNMNELQAAHVDCFNFSAVDVNALFFGGIQFLQR